METKTTTATTTTEFVGAKKFKMAKSKEYKEKVQTILFKLKFYENFRKKIFVTDTYATSVVVIY